MQRIHRMHVRSIKSWQSVNLSKHRKQSAAQRWAQAQDKYADTDWHREICFAKMFAILFSLAAAAAAAFFVSFVSSARRGIRQSSGLFIADESILPTNHMVRATRMISVCQLCSVAPFSFSSFGSRQSVYHLYSTQSRVSILARGKSRRHRIYHGLHATFTTPSQSLCVCVRSDSENAINSSARDRVRFIFRVA